MNPVTKMKDSESISNQQALVDALLGPSLTTIKRPIAGGKTMFETIEKKKFKDAVFNWLRGCGGFTEVTISLAKNPEQYQVATSQVYSAPGDESKPFWDKDGGRKELAELLANLLTTETFVYVQARPNGIYLARDTKKKFGPYVAVTDKNAAEFPGRNIGDKANSPEWEPYIEFKPANRSRYTNYRK